MIASRLASWYHSFRSFLEFCFFLMIWGKRAFSCLVAEVRGQTLPEAMPPIHRGAGSVGSEKVKMHREEVNMF